MDFGQLLEGSGFNVYLQSDVHVVFLTSICRWQFHWYGRSYGGNNV